LSEFEHQVIDHAVAYVDGKVHTNGCENFWSLLKRGINGTYVSVEPFHLFRYLDEQAYRYNNRKLTDSERCSIAVSGIVGKRLTFDQLTARHWKPKREQCRTENRQEENCVRVVPVGVTKGPLISWTETLVPSRILPEEQYDG